MSDNAILKGLVEDIINKYLNKVGSAELRRIINELIHKDYIKGLEEAEVQFNANYIPSYETIKQYEKFAFDNVTKLVEDTKEQLRQKVSLALMNRESPSSIKTIIRDVMDTTVERAKMIHVTESNRALNMGHFQGAKQSGLRLMKEWNAQPERVSRAGNMVPCTHCEFLDGQIVNLDAHFTDDQGQNIFLPPHHPNCACRVIYVQK